MRWRTPRRPWWRCSPSWIAVPAWVDLDAVDEACRYLGRFVRQGGIVLGAASLVGGYANSAASRPLEMTGRYVESAGARTIEVASWLVEANSAGGLKRYARGFELTVRVRIIHALVRRALRDDPRWDAPAWGVPICQAFLAYTLVEFCLIPMRGMAAIGAAFLPHEAEAYYARWRYIGHLLGIDPALLATNQAQQEALEQIYLLTRREVDDYCRDLVAAINDEFLVPEIEQLLIGRLRRLAPHVVHALERVFLGDQIADELAIGHTRITRVIGLVGPVLAGDQPGRRPDPGHPARPGRDGGALPDQAGRPPPGALRGAPRPGGRRPDRPAPPGT